MIKRLKINCSKNYSTGLMIQNMPKKITLKSSLEINLRKSKVKLILKNKLILIVNLNKNFLFKILINLKNFFLIIIKSIKRILSILKKIKKKLKKLIFVKNTINENFSKLINNMMKLKKFQTIRITKTLLVVFTEYIQLLKNKNLKILAPPT